MINGKIIERFRFGRDLQDFLVPSLCLGQGHPPGCSKLRPTWPWTLPGWGIMIWLSEHIPYRNINHCCRTFHDIINILICKRRGFGKIWCSGDSFCFCFCCSFCFYFYLLGCHHIKGEFQLQLVLLSMDILPWRSLFVPMLDDI